MRYGARKPVGTIPDDVTVAGGDIIGSDTGGDTKLSLTESRAQVVVDNAVKLDAQPTSVTISTGAGQGLSVDANGATTIASPIRTITADGTLTAADCVVMLDTSGGTLTLTLPAASTIEAGRRFLLKDKGAAGSNAAAVQCASSTIDGAGSITISENYAAVGLFTDGANWFIS